MEKLNSNVNERLTAFLEEEIKNTANTLFYSDPDFYLVEKIIKDHDIRLINTLLDIVGEEIEKKISEDYISKKTETITLTEAKQILTKIKSTL